MDFMKIREYVLHVLVSAGLVLVPNTVLLVTLDIISMGSLALQIPLFAL